MSDPIKKVELKDGTTRYRFRIDIDPDAVTGQRRQKTFTYNTYTEARDEYARKKTEINTGTFVPRNNITLNAVLDRYLNAATIDVEETTANNYLHALRPARDYFGTRRAQSLVEEDIDDLVTWMLTKGRKRGGKPGTGLGVRSVELTLSRLRAALDLAVIRRLVARNVARHTKIPRTARKKHAALKASRPYWGESQIKKFLTFLKGHRLEAPVLLSLMGVGPAELCGERWDKDVNLDSEGTDAETIQVADNTRTLLWADDGKQVVEKDGKTSARKRRLPLPAPVTQALKAFKAQQAAERLAAGEGYDNTGYLLVDELGQPFTTDQWRRALHRLMHEAGLPRVRPYVARHACLTYLATAGVPDVIVSAWAGHSDLNTAKRFYIHPNTEHLKGAAAQLGELFAG